MKKILNLRFTTILIFSFKIFAMEENTIEDYRKYAEDKLTLLTQDPTAIILHHQPHPDENDVPENIFICHNNSWFNIYIPLKNEIKNWNNPITNTCIATLLIERCNIFSTLQRSTKLHFSMKNPIDRTALSLELYFHDLPLIIGSILAERNNELLYTNPPEKKTVEKCKKILFQMVLFAALIGKNDPRIIFFIIETARKATTTDRNNDVLNITMPISTLNMLNRSPFEEKYEIIQLIYNQNAQKENPFLKECLKYNTLIFFTPAGTAELECASINITQFFNKEEKKKEGRCSIQ